MADGHDFGELIAAVARKLSSEPDTKQTLLRTVELAAEHLGGDVQASISLVVRRGEVETPAASDERAQLADQLQYELEEGPCWDAIWEHETFQIDDLLTEQRYPNWAHRVAESTGIRSSLSFQLFTTQDTLGALNLYSTRPRAFSDQDREEGQMFAAQAAIALQSARIEDTLRSALMARHALGQAQGILMERYQMSADRAFDLLRRVARRSELPLRVVAARLVDTGEMPAQ